MIEPFPFQLFRRFMDGASVSQLSEELGIPQDRIEMRLRCVARCLQTRAESGAAANSVA